MKNRLCFRLTLAAAALCAAACASLDNPLEQPSPIVAAIESMTRTQFSPEGDIYKVNWCTGDRIAVCDGVNTLPYRAEAGGAPTATFLPESGAMPGEGPWTAWYPAEMADGVLPSIQQYAPDGVAETPMRATGGAGTLSFRNLCGAIRLDVATTLEGIVLDRIVLSADQPLSGPFTCSGDVAVVTEGTGLRLDCSEVPLGADSKSFYISVPANVYSGLAITLYTTDGRCQSIRLKEGATYGVERSEVCEIGLIANDFETTPVSSAILRPGPDFNHELKKLSGKRRNVTGSDNAIRRIVFETGSRTTGGVRIDDFDSPWPIWMNYTSATGTVTVSTLADEIRTGTNAAYMFSYLKALEEVAHMDCLNTEEATMMNNMFHYAGSAAEAPLKLDFSSFNTARVISFYQMFFHCETVEKLDLSSFETPSLLMMDNMFAHCYNLAELDVSRFNTSRVTVFRSLFNRCRSLRELDLDNFDTGSGQLMTYMFYMMDSLEKLSIRNFTVNRSDANIGYMFRCSPSLREIHLGEGFIQESAPNSFFAASSDADGDRTASLSGSLTLYCTPASADWLAGTTLRWIHSGYKGATPVEVVFIDSEDGQTLTPTWPAN